MADFNIKQGDTRPALLAQLYEDSSEVDLTGATVKFHMGTSIDAPATIREAATGKVKYQWAAGDTDTGGLFDFEFEVTFPDGRIETFPNDKHNTVLIYEALA